MVDRLPHVAALHADSGYSATVSGTPCRLLQTLSNPWPQQAWAPQPRRPWLCPHPMPKQSFAGNLTAGQTVTSRSPKRLQCSPAKSVAILSSFVIDKNIPYYMCSHALVRVTCLFWFKRNETFSSNVVETRGQRHFRHTGYTACNKKVLHPFIYRLHKNNSNAFDHFEGNGIYSKWCMHYAGTAKLGSDHRGASTTRHGSDFLNSPTCRVQHKKMGEQTWKQNLSR